MKSYANNTYKGLVKNYNKDKVVAENHIQKPKKANRAWRKMSSFGIFDGHGGEACSKYQQNHFLNFLI